MSIIMRNLLIIILIFCVYLNWGCTEGAQERDSGKVDYHTVQLSSLLSTGSNTKGSLHVVDKHVVRSPLRRSKVTRLDLENILRQDRARLDYIHSRLSNNFADQPRQTESKSKDISVKDVSKRKSELDWGSYIETIGNGNT
ncbi:aspartyl protease family protein At5g10770 [Raphanus sativus]|uniref:Aspartyl protease family protein At5g10770 n=1 Tax=Raphanus sativus TaxID=3726 RepID=A0A6J0KA34_RAPSA|nr:aspartyl protease family protein At5g10770 [Raphanus sativus]